MFVFSNLAISLDGKIATADRSHFPLGTDKDRKQMQVLRRRSDAILMGASTVQAYRKPCLAKGAHKQPINIVLSRNLKGISPQWPFFTHPAAKKIIYVTERLSLSRLRTFEKNATVVLLKKNLPLAPQIIRDLSKRKIRRLLVEGGGEVMWHFVEENLIEEYNVTVTPRILGGAKAPTLVEGPGLSPKQSLKLKLTRCKKIGDELYLVYRRTN